MYEYKKLHKCYLFKKMIEKNSIVTCFELNRIYRQSFLHNKFPVIHMILKVFTYLYFLVMLVVICCVSSIPVEYLGLHLGRLTLN